MVRILIAGAVLAAGALMAVRQQPRATEGDVPLLATPAWQGDAAKYGEQLLLRRDPQSARVLLMKRSGRDGAYRYDGSTRTLAPVTEQDWLRAGGPIAECGKQGPPTPQVLRIDQTSHTLLAGSRELDDRTMRITLQEVTRQAQRLGVLAEDAGMDQKDVAHNRLRVGTS